ncbi:hypothetical protein LguiA_005777 [Lonicera macranthoides]
MLEKASAKGRKAAWSSPIGLRPQTRNEKVIPSAFSSSPKRSISSEKVDQPSLPIANIPTSVLPAKTQIPCVSSGSTPDKHVLVENVNRLGPSTAEAPTSNIPQPQEPLSNLQTFANSPVPSSRSPDQNMGGYNQKDKPSKRASNFNCMEIAVIVVKDCFDPNEVASKVDLALVTVNGYRVKDEMTHILRSIITKYEDT